MSERFLKYETEVENGMVDERGVLIPGAAGGGMTIMEVDSPYIVNGELYDKVNEMVQNGNPICFYYNKYYTYPLCVKNSVIAGTTDDSYSNRYVLEFYVTEPKATNDGVNQIRIQIIKDV